MKFTIEAKQFAKAVHRLSAVLDKKRFYGVLLYLQPGSLIVECSNGESVMRESLAVKNDEEYGSIFLQYDRLYSIVSKEAGDIDFDSISGKATIKGTNAVYEIGTMATPSHTTVYESESPIAVSAKKLSRAFVMAGITDSLENYHSYSMNKICLEIRDNELVVWSMDPIKVVMASCPLAKSGSFARAIIPDQACAFAASIFPTSEKKNESAVQIFVVNNDLVFKSENRYFSTRQSAGNLPDPYRFLQSSSPYEFECDTKELLACVSKAASALTPEHRSCRVFYEDGRLNFSVKSSSSTVRSWIEISDCGMAKDHYIDPKIPAGFLRRLDGEKATIGFDAKCQRVTIRSGNAVTVFSEMGR